MTKLSKRMGPAMKAWNVAIQARISTTSRLLHQIKEVKMLGSIASWINVIQGQRVVELERSKKFRTLIAYMNMLGQSPALLFMIYQLWILKKLIRKYPNGTVTHRHFRHRHSCTGQKRPTLHRGYSLHIPLYYWPDRRASLTPFIRCSVLLQLPGLL